MDNNFENMSKKIQVLPCLRVPGNNKTKPMEERHYALPFLSPSAKGVPCATISQIRDFILTHIPNNKIKYLSLADIDGNYIVNVETGDISDYKAFISNN